MSEPPAHKAEPPVSISTEGVHPEPRKTGHRLVDFSIALSAIVISLISLAVGIHHGRVQERLVAATSWPFLSFPALLKSLVVRYKGKPVRGWFELLEQCCGVERTATLDLPALGFFSGGTPKAVISSGQSVILLSLWRLPENLHTRAGVQGGSERVRRSRRRIRRDENAAVLKKEE